MAHGFVIWLERAKVGSRELVCKAVYTGAIPVGVLRHRWLADFFASGIGKAVKT